MHHIHSNQRPLFGACNASLKEGQATHAWILSSGNISDIVDDNMNLHGSGPVHCYPTHLSSSQGELAGLAAISIVTQLLLKVFSSPANVSVVCDNKAMVNKCNSIDIPIGFIGIL
ncbi:MAG: hypothetical protein ACK53Y_06215 [bacterium]